MTEVKNKMDLADPDITCVGQYDADELEYIKTSAKAMKLVAQGRIGLDGDYDEGNLWVKLGDAEAFKVASEVVM